MPGTTTPVTSGLLQSARAAELPLPDRVHPDPEAHRHIGERFAALAFGDGGPHARRGGGSDGR